MNRRVLIVGWDGADWEILDDLLGRGLMPNLASMIEEGARGDLMSTIPTHSWSAWSTFLTGVNPGRHGVYDFVQRDPTDPARRVPVSSAAIREETFLERISEAGLEVRAGNVPVTFPPFPVNGRLISGVAIPPGASFVYPSDWARQLEQRAPFPINGLEWVRFRHTPMALVEEARMLVERRSDSFELLLEGDWSAAAVVYVAPDRLQHALTACLHPSHPEYERRADTDLAEALRGVYGSLDRRLGRLREVAGDRATVLLISDHGFRPINRSANINRVLEHLGFAAFTSRARARTRLRRSAIVQRALKTKAGRKIKQRFRAPSSLDWPRTIAYQATAGPGVSLNLEGRERTGVVKAGDYERVREEVADGLLAFRDPVTGEAPIAGVIRREELYAGPATEAAPDLLVRASSLWAFAHTDALSEPTEWPTGAHRREGILVAAGEGVARGGLGERNIADIPATILSVVGIRPEGLDGASIDEVSPAQPETTAPGPPSTSARAPADLSDDEEEHVLQHLRDLGYIE